MKKIARRNDMALVTLAWNDSAGTDDGIAPAPAVAPKILRFQSRAWGQLLHFVYFGVGPTNFYWLGPLIKILCNSVKSCLFCVAVTQKCVFDTQFFYCVNLSDFIFIEESDFHSKHGNGSSTILLFFFPIGISSVSFSTQYRLCFFFLKNIDFQKSKNLTT